MPDDSPSPKAAACTIAAMLAFAGNSLLCRLALRDDTIDPGSFTALRLVSGALALLLIVYLRGRRPDLRVHGNPYSALMLFVYAAAFSYAYVSLSAASGALILFGFVQASMIAVALWRGERPRWFEWAGWLLAATGLLWLLLPGADAPATGGALLMAAAGIAWGIYSLRGAGARKPVESTLANFVFSLPMLLLLAPFLAGAHWTSTGVWLAIASGALTSGLGYVLWYVALRHLRSIQAALVQLSVPAIAAAGGVLLLREPLSARLVLAGGLILGGILLARLGRERLTRVTPD